MFSQCTLNSTDVFSFNYDNKSYEIIKVRSNYSNAINCAIIRGGYLAEINSLSENDAIRAQFPSAGMNLSQTVVSESGSPGLWLGGNDFVSEGTWVWNGNNDFVEQIFYTATSGSLLYSNFGCIHQIQQFVSQIISTVFKMYL